MEVGKPSQTALLVAALRAWHFQNTSENHQILKDSLAGMLAGLETEEKLTGYLDMIEGAFTAMSSPETAKKFLNDIEISVCARARLVEEELSAAKNRGATQLVILGAGLDTTAYRELELCNGIEVFEVDHPDSQRWKLECLAGNNITPPDNLKFVPFDFENTNLKAALAAGGISTDKTTVFSWLGVHMYLTDEAVRKTLETVTAFPAGSCLIMDFVQPDYTDAGVADAGSVDNLRKVVAGMREPFLSEYSVPELTKVFEETGFTGSDFPTIGEFMDRYMPKDNNIKIAGDAQFLAIGRI